MRYYSGDINEIVYEQMEHFDKTCNYFSHNSISLEQNRTLLSDNFRLADVMNDNNDINTNVIMQDMSNKLNKCCINVNYSVKKILFSNNQQQQQKKEEIKITICLCYGTQEGFKNNHNDVSIIVT